VVRSRGHHRYAYDLAAVGSPSGSYLTKSGMKLLLSGASVEDSYSWAQPVHAPADATVIDLCNDAADHRSLRRVTSLGHGAGRHDGDFRALAGNFLLLKIRTVFVLLAHLRHGSICVSKGDTLCRGDMVGEVGNSGSSRTPHLHLQVVDGPDPLRAATLGFLVNDYERWNGRQWQPVRYRELVKGERVRFGRND
jgi:murein DD-endopeptidase MepM/ murein hydrolase activator NlpD